MLPSLSEGLPLALLEAMFAARPIVASDVGEVGVALARGAAGLLVEPGDPNALAAAINRLLDDPDRARGLGESAARRAVTEYDVSQMARRYLGVYEQVLRRRPGGLDNLAQPTLSPPRCRESGGAADVRVAPE